MKCAMMQPTFLPWLGYFELILETDCFIFLDDFQFSLQSYQQRNRLFINQGQVGWCTVPVRKVVSFLAPLNRATFAEETDWRGKLWRRIEANYSRAPFFNEMAPWVRAWLLQQHESLASQNMAYIRAVCALLHIQREFRFSSQYPASANRSQRVLQLLRWCDASCYLCAHGSSGYMMEDGIFPCHGVSVLFQNFQCHPYPQVGSPGSFAPFLSSLDALFNVGPDATLALIRNGTARWSTWDEMLLESTAGDTPVCDEVTVGNRD